MQDLDVSKYDGLVSVSGDGLFHEIVNGLMSRGDWDAIKSKVTLGILPGGTSNGLVKSLLHQQHEVYSSLNAAWLIVKNRKSFIDITRLALEFESKPLFSFLSVSWAVIADCDINSEVIRRLGSARFTLWGIWRVLSLIRYEGAFTCNGYEIKDKKHTSKTNTEIDQCRAILLERQ